MTGLIQGLFSYLTNDSNHKKKSRGHMVFGILVGTVLTVLIGIIPLFGSLIAGFAAGSITRGARRGLTAAFISGIIGLLVNIALLVSFIINAISVFGISIQTSNIGFLGVAAFVMLGVVIGILEIGSLILISFVGLVGGYLNARSSTVRS